jgi:hypothetical protein
VNAADLSRWLAPSPSIAVDGTEHAEATHEIRVCDLRARFGDVEAYVARCSCGWASETRTERFGERAARRDGLAHVEQHLPPYGHRRARS